VSKIGIFRCILCTFYSGIGGPHEDLAILKDWGFNLRFLMRIDISLLPDYLAHCHIRVTDPGLEGTYGKMEFAGFTSHVEFEASFATFVIVKISYAKNWVWTLTDVG